MIICQNWNICYFFAIANFGSFSANLHFLKCQSLELIPTLYLELNELCEKNMIFVYFGPQKGGFVGINRFDPQYFWPIIWEDFFSEAVYYILGHNSKFWDSNFFQ